MKIIESKLVAETDLPLQLNVSFNKVFDLFKKYADMEYAKHPYHSSAKKMVQLINKHPELNDGFSDYSLLDKYKEQIDLLLNPLFPEPLLLNEIKAASIPFSFTSFKFTNRFENILKNAGENYELNVRNFEEDSMYIMACTFILSFVHGFNVDLKRPFYFDIPDNTTGTMKYYRTTFNGDFSDITATENAPKLTEKDFKELLKRIRTY